MKGVGHTEFFMEAPNLLNPERRMLKVMQQDAGKEWTLEAILQACEWKDQAIAVGAGHGSLGSDRICVGSMAPALH